MNVIDEVRTNKVHAMVRLRVTTYLKGEKDGRRTDKKFPPNQLEPNKWDQK
jgi:hypothetical protein